MHEMYINILGKVSVSAVKSSEENIYLSNGVGREQGGRWSV